MPEYVLNRTFALRSTQGRVINFEKGQPVFVPPECVREALELGAEPVGVEGFDRAAALLGEETPSAQPDMNTDERVAAIKRAFAAIELSNSRADFTGGGSPHIKAIERIVGFAPDARERDTAWLAYKEAKVAAADAAAALSVSV